MSRKIIPFVVALILICLIMAVAGMFAFSGGITAEKFGASTAWSKPFSSAESMKIIDFTGDQQDELFVQNTSDVTVYDSSGAVIWNFSYNSPKTTLGDVDGDGVEDIIVYYVGTGMSVDVISKTAQKTIATALKIGFPARVALIRFPTGPEIILGDSDGNLLALSLDGKPLWNSNLGSNEVRGMDDAKISGQTYVAIATNNGNLAVYDAQGKQAWADSQEQLRRLRAFDLNGDGNSEIITGGEYGS